MADSDARRELAEPVSKALHVFAALLANPKPVTPLLVQGWVLTLAMAGLKPEEVEPAVGMLLRTQTFFPTPAEFLAAARPPEDVDAAAELAWQRALECVRRIGYYGSLTAADLEGDAAALWALSRLGWERLCGELELDNRQWWRLEFVRVYQLARREGARLSYLVGACERLNDAAGRTLTPELCGRPDWPALPARGAEVPALAPGLEWEGRELPETGSRPLDYLRERVRGTNPE